VTHQADKLLNECKGILHMAAYTEKKLRADLIAIARAAARSMEWAIGLPVELIDEETKKYLQSIDGNPKTGIEDCNPFAVKERLSEVASLYELVSRLRVEVQSKETTLYSEILAESQAIKTEESAKKLAIITLEAEWKASGKTGAAPTVNVDNIYTAIKNTREQKNYLRGFPGHPLNLLEQIHEIRERYKRELRLLLVRAEAIRLTMSSSYPYAPRSLLKEILDLTPENPNPVPVIGNWLRDLSLLIEKSMQASRVVTLYRFIQKDGWTTENIAEQLGLDIDCKFSLALNRRNLGLKDDEYARMIAIGVAPAFNETRIDTFKLANEKIAWINHARATRKLFSFDMDLLFDEAILKDKLDSNKEYHFTKPVEIFGGIAGWGIDSNCLEDHLNLRQIVGWTNRPLGGEVNVRLANAVRDSTGVMTRGKLPYAGIYEQETKMHDIVIGLQFYVFKKE
jgi:hypothetical protein